MLKYWGTGQEWQGELLKYWSAGKKYRGAEQKDRGELLKNQGALKIIYGEWEFCFSVGVENYRVG